MPVSSKNTIPDDAIIDFFTNKQVCTILVIMVLVTGLLKTLHVID